MFRRKFRRWFLVAAVPVVLFAPAKAWGYESIQDCMRQGGGLIQCVIDVLQCHINHNCTVNGEPV